MCVYLPGSWELGPGAGIHAVLDPLLVPVEPDHAICFGNFFPRYLYNMVAKNTMWSLGVNHAYNVFHGTYITWLLWIQCARLECIMPYALETVFHGTYITRLLRIQCARLECIIPYALETVFHGTYITWNIVWTLEVKHTLYVLETIFHGAYITRLLRIQCAHLGVKHTLYVLETVIHGTYITRLLRI